LPGLEAYNASPLRRQYLDIKRRYPDAILFFRLGDFFETFESDAETMARELEIALTARDFGRGERVPMAGIPCHAAEGYIARLVSRGFRIAVCEQVGDAPSRGLVDRQVVRVITPGTVVEEALLSPQANNYLAAVVPATRRAGLAFVDVSTGEFGAAELAGETWRELLKSALGWLNPAELLLPTGTDLEELLPPESHVAKRDDDWGDGRRAVRALCEHFGVPGLEGVGLAQSALAAQAAGWLIAYVRETQPAALRSLERVKLIDLHGRMVLDAGTRVGLELLANLRDGTKEGSLLGVLDRTRTAMGARLLRGWVSQPLITLGPLVERQEQVAQIHASLAVRTALGAAMRRLPDLERLAARAAQLLLGPRDCLALADGLAVIPELNEVIDAGGLSALESVRRELDACPDVQQAIRATLVEDPPAAVGEGVIRPGLSPELDELRSLAGDTRDLLARLERQERDRTGVRALKLGYNRVFGYYIEVSSATLRQPTDYYQREQTGAATIEEHLDRLGYARRQTLASAERYVTQQLKEYETRVERAQEEMARLERQLYQRLLEELARHGDRLLRAARAAAHVDVLIALAEVAANNHYVRPELSESDGTWLEGARHPVVEQSLPPGVFVPNDAALSASDNQIVILTGPNMAGKSTYLRQVALLVLMAQIGSFVPARAARIGLVDRIFARIGSQDDIASGRSTFMVEMNEVAAILRGASPRSLIILDEVGRGTSTYDGISIARAVVEYLHDAPGLGCRTLFATHYHELAELAQVLPRARAFRVEVLEQGNQVVFLHRVVPGGADRSYGIYVAQLAGVPDPVIARARDVLRDLEEARARGVPGRVETVAEDVGGVPVGEPHSLVRELAALDVDGLTPLRALNLLHDLVQRARAAQ
jgi:DNA mismatch repair protein MutS